MDGTEEADPIVIATALEPASELAAAPALAPAPVRDPAPHEEDDDDVDNEDDDHVDGGARGTRGRGSEPVSSVSTRVQAMSASRVLHTLFVHYCNANERVRKSAMTALKFRYFAKDAGLVGPTRLQLTDVDIAFSASVEARSGAVMSEKRFFEACGELAIRCFEDEADLRACMKRLLDEHLRPLACRTLSEREQHAARETPPDTHLSDEVREMVHLQYAPKLKKLFRKYAQLEPERRMYHGGRSSRSPLASPASAGPAGRTPSPLPSPSRSSHAKRTTPRPRPAKSPAAKSPAPRSSASSRLQPQRSPRSPRSPHSPLSPMSARAQMERAQSVRVLVTTERELHMEQRQGIQVDPDDIEATMLVSQARRSNWEQAKQAMDTMNLEEFIRFARDFDIFPSLISHNDMLDVFGIAERSSGDEQGQAAGNGTEKDPDASSVAADSEVLEDPFMRALNYEQFVVCLLLIARTAYRPSDEPAAYSDADLMELLLLKLDERDKVIGITPRLRNAPATPGVGPQTAALLPSEVGPDGQVEPLAPSSVLCEADMKTLERLFVFYCNPANKVMFSHTLPRSRFSKLCRDLHLLSGGGVTQADVDITFNHVKSAHSSASESSSVNMGLDFDHCFLALCELALRRFPDDPVSRSLEHVVRTHGEPIVAELNKNSVAKDGGIGSGGLDRGNREEHAASEDQILLDPTVRSLLLDYNKALKGVFRKYAKRDHTNRKAPLREEGFFKFCRAFSILPGFLALKPLARIFRVVSSHSKGTDGGLQYEEFLECVVRIAVKCFSDDSYAEEYPTTAAKLELLIFHLDDQGHLGFHGFKHRRQLSNGGQRARPTVMDLLQSDEL